MNEPHWKLQYANGGYSEEHPSGGSLYAAAPGAVAILLISPDKRVLSSIPMIDAEPAPVFYRKRSMGLYESESQTDWIIIGRTGSGTSSLWAFRPSGEAAEKIPEDAIDVTVIRRMYDAATRTG